MLPVCLQLGVLCGGGGGAVCPRDGGGLARDVCVLVCFVCVPKGPSSSPHSATSRLCAVGQMSAPRCARFPHLNDGNGKRMCLGGQVSGFKSDMCEALRTMPGAQLMLLRINKLNKL